MRMNRRGGRLAPALLTAGALLAAALPARGAGGEVQGRVIFQGAGWPGVTVDVYLQAGMRSGGTPFAGTVTGDGGAFTLALPPGEYYLVARENAAAFGPRKIGEYPGPVRVPAGGTVRLDDLAIAPAGTSREGGAAEEGAGISGRVFSGGAPVEGAAVMVYDGAAAHLKGPGYAAMVLSDAAGRFQVDLDPGAYQVTVRHRREGQAAGFLRPGDLSAVYGGNPVTVTANAYADLGAIDLHPVDEGKLAAEERSRRQGTTQTRVTGRVVDTEGKPRAGQFVFMYRDPAMIGRPDILATTGEDGAFVLSLAGGGTYYVGARSSYGGPRQPGEWVGRLDGSADSSVRVVPGEDLRDLRIVMEETW